MIDRITPCSINNSRRCSPSAVRSNDPTMWYRSINSAFVGLCGIFIFLSSLALTIARACSAVRARRDFLPPATWAGFLNTNLQLGHFIEILQRLVKNKSLILSEILQFLPFIYIRPYQLVEINKFSFGANLCKFSSKFFGLCYYCLFSTHIFPLCQPG